MRSIAIGFLLVIMLSVLLEPMAELVNVMREKIVLGTAITNACRAAKDRSLQYERLRGLDAEVNPALFKDYFAEAFEDVMNLRLVSSSGQTMIFTSEDGKYHDFSVELEFIESMDPYTEQTITEVSVKAEAAYKFKTKYLKLAEAASQDVGFLLRVERKLLLSVKN